MTTAYLVRMDGVVVCPPSWFPNLPTTISEHEFARLMEGFPVKIKKVDKKLAKNHYGRRAWENHCMCTGDMDARPMYHKAGQQCYWNFR